MEMKPGERAAEALLARYCLDPAFTDALRHDARLCALEEALAHPSGDMEELLILAGGSVAVCGVLVKPPPPAVLSVLWACGSPLVCGGPWNYDEALLALYVICRGRHAFLVPDRDTVLRDAKQFAQSFVPPQLAAGAARQLESLMRMCERPYDRLPADAKTTVAGPPCYDALWLAQLAGRVHDMTGLPPDRIIWDMPMTSAALYDVAWRVRECGIRPAHPTDRATERAYKARTYWLVRRYHQTITRGVAKHAAARGVTSRSTPLPQEDLSS